MLRRHTTGGARRGSGGRRRPSGRSRGRPSPTFEATLRDGRRVHIRPVREADRGRIERFLRRIGPRKWCFGPGEKSADMARRELERLDDVDGRNVAAWIAVDADDPVEPAVAVARFVKRLDHPQLADLAVAVADGYRGRGLGKLLMDTAILNALEHGVARVFARIRPGSRAAERLVANAGATFGELEDGLLQVEIPVSSSQRAFKQSGPLPRLPRPTPVG